MSAELVKTIVIPDADAMRFGRMLMRGALMELTFWLCVLIIACIVTGRFCRNDTDPPGFWSRSGLTVHRDAKTGVEYLEAPNGGLIKRETTHVEK